MSKQPTIFKYVLESIPGGETGADLVLPRGSKVLSTRLQRRAICVWVRLSDRHGNAVERHRVRAYITGGSAPPESARLLGTLESDSGIVWHVFEEDDDV